MQNTDKRDSAQPPVTPTSLIRALEQIGDPWSLHLIRAAYLGLRRFQDFQELLDIPRQTLMLRLKKLTENAIFYRQPVRHKRIVYEYRLTPKGLDLYPFVIMIWAWHTSWHLDESVMPRNLVHRECGRPLQPIMRCSACQGSLEPESIEQQSVASTVVSQNKGKSRRTRIINEWETLGEEYLATVVIGDYWSILVLNAVLRGVSNYDALQKNLSISSNVLSARLKTLVNLKLMEQQPNEIDRRMLSYIPTVKGRDMYPLIIALINWGDRWLAGGEPPPEILHHRSCGEILVPEIVCGSCDQRLIATSVSRPNTAS